MRWSQFFWPTLKEDPSEAELPGHKLMIRAGLIRKNSAGVYSYLPAGLKVLEKTCRLIREEMKKTGAQEILLPVLQPAELWEKTGRAEKLKDILFSLKDRHGRNHILGPTHEEIITALASHDIRSYKELPLVLFQIQTKFRDEFRPRSGLLRGREFLMKDAYSFHENRASLDRTYAEMYEAYLRIFRKMGISVKAVDASSGDMGGDSSHEFIMPSDSGEDILVHCSSCGIDQRADTAELAEPIASSPEEGNRECLAVYTPGVSTIEQVSLFLKTEPSCLVKTLLYAHTEGTAAVLIRGDCEISDEKLASVLHNPVLADEDTVRKLTGADVGFAGPVGLDPNVPVFADFSIKGMTDYITGANRTDTHLTGVNTGRDFSITRFCDVRIAVPGDRCSACGTPFTFSRGIELGHMFKLGTRYSQILEASFSDAAGGRLPLVMGCYGIGVSRLIAAQVEFSHDEKGILWRNINAPFTVCVTALNYQGSEGVRTTADSLYADLQKQGIDVILDDREERPGSKFKDSELTGIPLRVTIGERGIEKGTVEIQARVSEGSENVPLKGMLQYIKEKIRETA